MPGFKKVQGVHVFIYKQIYDVLRFLYRKNELHLFTLDIYFLSVVGEIVVSCKKK